MIEYLAVGIGPLVILGVILYANVRQNINEIKENWTKYRCHPAYMPFVSMFTDDVSTTDNFKFCTNAFASELLGRATDPVYQMFDMFVGVFKTFLDDIQHFLKYLASMDTFIFSFVNGIFGKIQNTFGVFLQQLGTLRDILNRITGSAYYAAFIAQTFIDFVMSSFNLMMSLVKAVAIMILALGIILMFFYPIILAFFIPIGALFGVSFCFDPETIVHTQRGDIAIKDILVGDKIETSIVTGIFYMECPPIDLYVYNGVIVSGRHMVYDTAWKYVRDAPSAQLYLGPRPSSLICLNTDNNIIQIGNTLFRDYEETSDPAALSAIETIVWGKKVDATYPPGLHPSTHVRTSRGEYVEISNVKVGDTLEDGKVLAVVVLDGSDIVWYTVGETVMSGCQPVFKKLAKDIGVLTGKRYPIAIQLIVENTDGWFTVNNNVLVRDYPDSHDPLKLESIQSVVLKSLQAKK